MIKVILLDIDGTLTNDDKVITPKTRETLIKAQQLGARVILASGRPTSGLWDFGNELMMNHYHGLFVAYNGSKVIDCQTEALLFNQAMTIEEGKAVLEHMKQFKVIPIIDKDDYMYVNNVYNCYIDRNEDGVPFNIIQYESRNNKYLLCEKEDLAAFANFEINKILTAGDPAYLREHYQEMEAPFKDSLNCMFTAPFYFEYTAKGIDKAKAIDTVISNLGYTKDEIIAFGDAQNDISMVKYAGIGVAMANGCDELKEAADEITLSNNDDGIVYSLIKHMPELSS